MGLRTVLSLFLALLAVAPPATARESKLLFFDPDANQERLLTINELFNRYLGEQKAAFVFEPVQTAGDFSKRLDARDAAFAIVSSSYLQAPHHGTLTPLLVQETGGQVYYHKLLVDMGAGQPMQLQGKTIAASISDARAAETLAFLKSSGVNVAGAFIISVSKDVDALLAMTFGQADAALVTEGSIKVLQQLSPAAAKQVRTLLKTGNILRAPLCEVAGRASPREREEIVKYFADLPKTPSGQQLLEVLGVTDWVPYAEGML